MLHGSVIKMLVHAAVRSAQLNQFCSCTRSPLVAEMKDLAARRKLNDLTIGPVLTVTTEAMLEHKNKLLQIPGSKFIFVEILKDDNYELVPKEIFGPFQIVTEYKDNQLPMVLNVLERMHAHLTAAVVSNDDVLGKSVNGTTYVELRARTTGAPQNHWFGPAGDPRGAGIGTPEAIKLVWSCHRKIIYDVVPIPQK